jgi:hypothetical protein
MCWEVPAAARINPDLDRPLDRRLVEPYLAAGIVDQLATRRVGSRLAARVGQPTVSDRHVRQHAPRPDHASHWGRAKSLE